MGYAYYEIYRDGEKIQAGYSVEAVCEEPGCEEQIDRGLAYLCGETPGGDEGGCGGYFCGEHLYMAHEGQHGERCIRCHDKGTDPLETSPDAMVATFGQV
ncbi:hypothetical protein ACH4GK_31835 [Streptomyces rimosus]|uniref:hypothetical protein n=1 Tax=Streptomyces rimosus TaxID=1927 RepID=UPI00067B065A|nr:hypothetical protein [Streptomyces rimosus]